MTRRRLAPPLPPVPAVGGLPIGLALAGLALLSATVRAAEAGEEQLRSREQESLGKLVGEYFDAKDARSGTLEALDELRKEVDKLEKKHARTLDGSSVLAWVTDWEKAIFLARSHSTSGIRKGRVETTEVGDEFGTVYAVHVPRTYNPRSGPLPLVLVVPDEKEAPEQHLRERWQEGDVRDEVLLVVPRMPSNPEAWTALGDRENPSGIMAALFSLRHAKETYAVDPDRIFLAGHGQMGVAAAAYIAAAFPHVFAGFVGISGDVPEGLPAVNFRNLPSLFLACGGNSTALVERMKEAGIENATADASGGETEAWAWASERAREANPLEVSLRPVADRVGSGAYWLRIESFEIENDPRVDARIDREENAIFVDAERIGSVWIYFNDVLADLDRPVKIVVNGVETQERIPRDLQKMVDLAYLDGDAGRVYVNSKQYVVPPKPE